MMKIYLSLWRSSALQLRRRAICNSSNINFAYWYVFLRTLYTAAALLLYTIHATREIRHTTSLYHRLHHLKFTYCKIPSCAMIRKFTHENIPASGTSTDSASAFYPPSNRNDCCRIVGIVVIVWCQTCNRWNNSDQNNSGLQRPHTTTYHNCFFNGPNHSNMKHDLKIQRLINKARREQNSTNLLNSNTVSAQVRENNIIRTRYKRKSRIK